LQSYLASCKKLELRVNKIKTPSDLEGSFSRIISICEEYSFFNLVSLAQNILKLCTYASKETIKDIIIPIAIDFTKSPDF
jgi:hypothetical protein